MSLFTSLQKLFGRSVSTLHFDEAYCRIYYHHDINTVHLDWDNQASSAQFTTACDFALRLLVEKKAKKMIADNSKVNSVSVENQNWLIEHWFPRAVEEGFQYSAVIQSRQEIVKSALQFIVSKVSTNHVIVQNFKDLPSAKKWLARMK